MGNVGTSCCNSSPWGAFQTSLGHAGLRRHLLVIQPANLEAAVQARDAYLDTGTGVSGHIRSETIVLEVSRAGEGSSLEAETPTTQVLRLPGA